MKLVRFTSLLLLIIISSCRHQPDSSGKVYAISPDKAHKELYETLNEIIEDDDENSEAFYRRSKLYFEDGQLDKAYNDIDTALSLEAKNEFYLVHKAQILYSQSEHYKCYRLLQQVGEKYKPIEVKKIELMSGIKTGAIKDVSKIETSISEMGFSEGRRSYLLGIIAWDKKDSLATRKYLLDAYKKEQKGEDVLLTLAKLSSSDQKEQLLTEAANQYETRRSRLSLSEFYARENKQAGEDSIYSLMLKINPKDDEIIARRARLYHSQGEKRKLVSLLEGHALSTKTKTDDRMLAEAYFSLRQNKQAKEIYEGLLLSDTTGQIDRQLRIIKRRSQQNQLNNLQNSLGTIAKDTVNSRP